MPPDPDGARLHDAVVHHQPVVLVQPRGQVVEEVAHRPLPPVGQVLGDAADAEPVRVHARPADGRDDGVEEPLAVLEHVEDGREGADVLGEGAVEDQVAGDAEELAEHDADHLGAVRHLDAAELLDREDPGEVVHHAAQIVDAVGVGDERVPGLAFAHLLGAAVVKADVGDAVDDLLVAQAHDDAQRAVRRAVLRADVQVHQRRVVLGARQAPLLGLEAQVLLPTVEVLARHRERAQLGAARRRLLAQRVPLPPGRREEAGEVRVPADVDPEHVPDLALVPVGAGPDAGDRVDRRPLAAQRHLEAQVGVPRVRDEVVEDREVGLGLALARGAEALVDRAQVVERRRTGAGPRP